MTCTAAAFSGSAGYVSGCRLFQQRITTYDNGAASRPGTEFYPGAGRPATITEVIPIIEQPTSVPSGQLPPSPTPARIVRTSYVYEVDWPTPKSHFVHLSRVTTDESEGDEIITAGGLTILGNPPILRQQNTAYMFDLYGNVKSESQTTVGGVTRTRTTTYENNPLAWLITQPRRVEMIAYGAGDPVPQPRVVGYEYDGLGRLAATTVERTMQIHHSGRRPCWIAIIEAVSGAKQRSH